MTKVLQRSFGFAKNFKKTSIFFKKGVDKRAHAWYSIQALGADGKRKPREQPILENDTVKQERKQGQSRNESFEELRNQRLG